jgi:hypothetical protein
MQQAAENQLEDTIRIRKPPRVFTDYLGRTVWMSGVDPFELELDIDFVPSTDPYNRADLRTASLP